MAKKGIEKNGEVCERAGSGSRFVWLGSRAGGSGGIPAICAVRLLV
jgi:hypothetical protein